MSKYRWRKMKAGEEGACESILRSLEPSCVAACDRFLRRRDSGGHVWLLDDDGCISALLLHWKQSLFPVFCGRTDTPLPKFLKRFLGLVHIHGIQGLAAEELSLERGMITLGYRPADTLDYELMSLDREPEAAMFGTGPAGLTLRTPTLADADELFKLQSGYDREEVLPAGKEFNAASCRTHLEYIIKYQKILAACLDGRIVAKINTSGGSFNRVQIGGVYVLPEYRRRGICRRLCAVFAQSIIGGGKGLSLYVKHRNATARRLYRDIGFRPIGDYRICYFED